MSDPLPSEFTDVYEQSGYEAGLAGLPLVKAVLWGDAWAVPQSNFPAHVIAGWVAGRAIALVRRATAS
jgi:hypothetical protein